MSTTGIQLEKQPLQAASSRTLQGTGALLWMRARTHWAAMETAQRRWSMVAAALLIGLLVFISWYGLRTDWRTLYAGLDPDDARQTGLTLTQAQIPFDVAANGTAILVPEPLLDKARLATAAKGGVRSGRLGFELFDKPNWVGSEFDERVNYQRALEGELEHTVGTLADVESARVHLVLPHDSLFRDEERPAKATVVLKLRRGALADGEADSIRNLVASAVDGLSPDRVILVDAAGRLRLGSKTAEAELLSAEQALEDKLIATLEPVTGPGNVRASVALDYDQSNSEETRETYDPDKSATLSMQRTEQTSGGQPVPAGVPGVASNAPNTQALPVYPKLTTPPETSKSESSTYGVSKDVQHVMQSPGRVRRLTAAVVVNDRPLHAGSKGAPNWQPWSGEQMRNLTALARAAVGFDATRGDVLTVQDLAFEDNNAQPASSFPGRFLAAAENSPELMKYIALFGGLLLVLAMGVRPALKQVHAELARIPDKPTPDAIMAGQEVAVAQPVETPELPASDPERLRAQHFLDQVTDHLKRDPAQSTRLLQSWIHSE
jgi:flagellar M-ring protein FliF